LGFGFWNFEAHAAELLPATPLHSAITRFNALDTESVTSQIPNSAAADFLAANAPRFDCPAAETSSQRGARKPPRPDDGRMVVDRAWGCAGANPRFPRSQCRGKVTVNHLERP
jgi:hypothetical protein